MTTADRNDLMPTQKLEWVTPKISLMGALMDTEGKPVIFPRSEARFTGPS